LTIDDALEDNGFVTLDTNDGATFCVQNKELMPDLFIDKTFVDKYFHKNPQRKLNSVSL
jgi:hypothetical protein